MNHVVPSPQGNVLSLFIFIETIKNGILLPTATKIRISWTMRIALSVTNKIIKIFIRRDISSDSVFVR